MAVSYSSVLAVLWACGLKDFLPSSLLHLWFSYLFSLQKKAWISLKVGKPSVCSSKSPEIPSVCHLKNRQISPDKTPLSITTSETTCKVLSDPSTKFCFISVPKTHRR